MDSNISNYLNAMEQARIMLKNNIINDEDYLKIESEMAKKYNLKKFSLFRQNDLIKVKFWAIYMIPKSRR